MYIYKFCVQFDYTIIHYFIVVYFLHYFTSLLSVQFY